MRELRRIGKLIAFGFDNDLWLILHLMIAGRLHWRPPRAKLAGRTIWLPSTLPVARFSRLKAFAASDSDVDELLDGGLSLGAITEVVGLNAQGVLPLLKPSQLHILK